MQVETSVRARMLRRQTIFSCFSTLSQQSFELPPDRANFLIPNRASDPPLTMSESCLTLRVSDLVLTYPVLLLFKHSLLHTEPVNPSLQMIRCLVPLKASACPQRLYPFPADPTPFQHPSALFSTWSSNPSPLLPYRANNASHSIRSPVSVTVIGAPDQYLCRQELQQM